MPYLTLTPNGGGSAVTVPLDPSSPEDERTWRDGSTERADDGSPLSSYTTEKTDWLGCQTKRIPRSEADTLMTLLKGTQPLTANGDLTGSSVAVTIVDPRIVERGRFIAGGANTEHVRVRFDMWQD